MSRGTGDAIGDDRHQAWIIDGVRSPRGKGKSNGSLHHIHPQELLAQVLNALRDRVGFDPATIDDVVVGNGNSAGDQGVCIGRMAVLAAGWPVEAPGPTLNRFCGSGQQAVTFAAMGVQAGHQNVVVGGGVEMMSRWPVDGPVDFTAFNPALRALYPLVPQGVSADLIATIEGFDREAVDAFALQSQQRAATAMAEGRFDRSVVPIHNSDGSVALAVDEFPRPSTTSDGLAKLAPSFAQMGAEVFDGFDRSFDEMARQAYPEINEAFAAVPLKTIRDLGLDPERVNVNGGAIAIGHPIGATGPMLIQTALDELERRDLSTALITMCTGGGMGTATIIERI